METNDLISAVRAIADSMRLTINESMTLNEAADRLEEQEERIAIMAENMDKTWGESYCTSTGVSRAGMKDTGREPGRFDSAPGKGNGL